MRAPVRQAGAILFRDVPKSVNAPDECAHEEEVDECDEHGVGFGAVVGEEGGDGPGEREDGDDEEDEDVVGGEGVLRGVDVHEVGEHAHGGDLWVRLVEYGGYGEGRKYQGDDLHEAPEGEEDTEEHGCGR